MVVALGAVLAMMVAAALVMLRIVEEIAGVVAVVLSALVVLKIGGMAGVIAVVNDIAGLVAVLWVVTA
jgi:hypothetical protein